MVGSILVVFVGVIVALALFNGGIVANVSTTTNTLSFDSANGQGTLTPNDVFQDLSGKSVSSFVAINATSGDTIEAGNYTILNNQVVDGVLTARINATTDYDGVIPWNVSYTYEPVGYINSAGGRSLANLIIVFAALAIGVFALIPAMRSGVMDLVKR